MRKTHTALLWMLLILLCLLMGTGQAGLEEGAVCLDCAAGGGHADSEVFQLQPSSAKGWTHYE